MLVVAFLAVLVLAGISALGVRRHLLDGRDALDRGKSDLIDGDAAAAQSEFDSAHEAFRAGADGARSIWLSIAGAIPVVGNTPDAVRAVADAGLKTADAASGIAGAVADLSGRAGCPRSHRRGDPDRPFGGVDGSHRTSRRADGARRSRRSEDAPTRMVLAPGRLRTFGGPGAAGDAASAAARRLADPRRLARVPGCRRPAPLPVRRLEPGRASRDRRIDRRVRDPHDGPREVQLLRLPTDPVAPPPRRADVPSPSQEYSDNWDFYRSGLGLWVNTNMTPDFPLAADALWLTYEATTGENVDGVIVADPFALKALMHVTAPGRGRLDRDRAHRQEHRPVRLEPGVRRVRHGGGAEARAGTGRASRARRIPGTGRGYASQAACVAAAFDDGHVLAWSVDPEMQRALATDDRRRRVPSIGNGRASRS